MRELTFRECELVNGAGLFYDAGWALGKMAARGTHMQMFIDSIGNAMLGAMSHGA